MSQGPPAAAAGAAAAARAASRGTAPPAAAPSAAPAPNLPLPQPPAAPPVAGSAPLAAIQRLSSLGFSHQQAAQALQVCHLAHTTEPCLVKWAGLKSKQQTIIQANLWHRFLVHVLATCMHAACPGESLICISAAGEHLRLQSVATCLGPSKMVMQQWPSICRQSRLLASAAAASSSVVVSGACASQCSKPSTMQQWRHVMHCKMTLLGCLYSCR